MYFTLAGTEYRLGFQYSTQFETRHRRPVRRGQVTLRVVEEREKRSASAILWRKVQGPRAGATGTAAQAPWHWERVAEAGAACSLKDRWNRTRGREIALGRLRLDLPAEMAQAAVAAYNSR